MNVEYVKNPIGKITPEMIVNYNEKEFERVRAMQNTIVLDYDYGADMYIAKAYDGYCYYKI